MNLKQIIRDYLYPPEDRQKEFIEALRRSSSRYKEAGVTVNDKTVATHGDVYTCIRILSTSIGQLPAKLTKPSEDGRVQVENTVTANIFTLRPNFYQTMQEWLEQAVTCLSLRGNFYVEIVRNRHGNIAQLIPFYKQDSVTVVMLTDGSIQYNYTTNDSKTGIAVKQTFSADKVLHIKAPTYDGFIGISPLTHARKELGISIATETHTASIFENDATPRMVLESDQSFGSDLEAFNRMRDSWNEQHKGPNKTGKPALLEYGFKAKPLQMTPVDTQLIDQRILSREKIAAMFGVPLHRLDSSGAKYGNIEHSNKAFYTDTLAPLITRIESHLNHLLPTGFKVHLDDSKFTRGDTKTMTEVVTSQISSGLITINEGREILGRETVDGGDVFAIVTNNLTFGTWEDYEQPDPNQTPPNQAEPAPEDQANAE